MTAKDAIQAQRILAQHEAGTRYIPVDVRTLLAKIVWEAAPRDVSGAMYGAGDPGSSALGDED